MFSTGLQCTRWNKVHVNLIKFKNTTNHTDFETIPLLSRKGGDVPIYFYDYLVNVSTPYDFLG